MLKAVSCDTLEQVSDLVGEYGVIGIDEGQFFPDVRGVLLTCVVGDPIPHTFWSLVLAAACIREPNGQPWENRCHRSFGRHFRGICKSYLARLFLAAMLTPHAFAPAVTAIR